MLSDEILFMFSFSLKYQSTLYKRVLKTKVVAVGKTHHSSELIESANPGVSTTVSLSFTPLSSISTVEASIFTVWLIFSVTITNYTSLRLFVCLQKSNRQNVHNGSQLQGIDQENQNPNDKPQPFGKFLKNFLCM